MITPRQIRAARALLGWSQQQLADNAIVSLNVVARLESGVVDSRISTVQAVQKALVKAGIEFLDADQKRRRGEAQEPEVLTNLETSAKLCPFVQGRPFGDPDSAMKKHHLRGQNLTWATADSAPYANLYW
jgi:transcriptional regulator with XRE-family HTH domain